MAKYTDKRDDVIDLAEKAAVSLQFPQLATLDTGGLPKDALIKAGDLLKQGAEPGVYQLSPNYTVTITETQVTIEVPD